MKTAIRGRILDVDGKSKVTRYQPDGVIVVNEGKICDRLSYAQFNATPEYRAVKVTDSVGALILPGFVDTHVHCPQLRIISSHGRQLLDWLNTYTFPEEARFEDRGFAELIASLFLEELLRNGTTSAMVFSTIHTEATDALFAAAAYRHMAIATGKVFMERHAPKNLLQDIDEAIEEAVDLIGKWHQHGRLRYAVTPRFAATSTLRGLAQTGGLFNRYPGLWLQSHVSENQDEIAWVKGLFPNIEHYLGVYDEHQLLTSNSIYAHCIHLKDKEWDLMAAKRGTIAFCPTSNTFLGSGLFPYHVAKRHQIRVGLGSDVGGGTSFSMFKTMFEAYKVSQLAGQSISPSELLFLATQGGADAIGLGDEVGNFDLGKWADFIVVDTAVTTLQKLRMEACSGLDEELFALIGLGDERNIRQTYVAGSLAQVSQDPP